VLAVVRMALGSEGMGLLPVLLVTSATAVAGVILAASMAGLAGLVDSRRGGFTAACCEVVDVVVLQYGRLTNVSWWLLLSTLPAAADLVLQTSFVSALHHARHGAVTALPAQCSTHTANNIMLRLTCPMLACFLLLSCSRHSRPACCHSCPAGQPPQAHQLPHMARVLPLAALKH
jgi:hypothetical protein